MKTLSLLFGASAATNGRLSTGHIIYDKNNLNNLYFLEKPHDKRDTAVISRKDIIFLKIRSFLNKKTFSLTMILTG